MVHDLKSDCKNCFALCCVALPFGMSHDFPFSKNGGEPCRNLCSNNMCSIHDKLKDEGFNGCVAYECFGAGQHVSQTIYGGKDWREDSEHAEEMFAVFPIVQQLYEMLWYLKQAMTLKETQPFHDYLQQIYNNTIKLTEKHPKEILELDIMAHRGMVNDLLKRASRRYRDGIVNKDKRIMETHDLIGQRLEGLDLRGEDFRGKLLIAANLSNSDLRKVDFIGADLRDTKLYGADLTYALFLTQSQINSAKGDSRTKIPSYLEKPSHWR
ncbi:pentapeptide repeat-containing protein [Gracilibacillus sp. HCP3S3_G5_1]|uniref:pentapeptide repeat-containing protein n=1 Tax=unclassified Gracilibacillus TaxID=2625209 RepID=UPI003F8AAA3B